MGGAPRAVRVLAASARARSPSLRVRCSHPIFSQCGLAVSPGVTQPPGSLKTARHLFNDPPGTRNQTGAAPSWCAKSPPYWRPRALAKFGV